MRIARAEARLINDVSAWRRISEGVIKSVCYHISQIKARRKSHEGHIISMKCQTTAQYRQPLVGNRWWERLSARPDARHSGCNVPASTAEANHRIKIGERNAAAKASTIVAKVSRIIWRRNVARKWQKNRYNLRGNDFAAVARQRSKQPGKSRLPASMRTYRNRKPSAYAEEEESASKRSESNSINTRNNIMASWKLNKL